MTKNQVQTNAEINPGNSGGGLFNMSGRLIGINTEKKTYTTATNDDGSTAQVPVEGIAYAISLSIVKQSIKDIESSGNNIIRPKLGITVTAVNRYISNDEYVKHLPNSNDAGILVIDAGNGSAYQAGVRTGDVILAMNGTSVFDLEDNMFPCIAHVIINKSMGHFIVIHKIDRNKKILTIADPAIGRRLMSYTEFLEITTNQFLYLLGELS